MSRSRENSNASSSACRWTVIRSIVLPSLLVLIGEPVWVMPRWLSWLPDVGLEGSGPETRLHAVGRLL